jgi:hypothetical protein
MLIFPSFSQKITNFYLQFSTIIIIIIIIIFFCSGGGGGGGGGGVGGSKLPRVWQTSRPTYTVSILYGLRTRGF